MYTEASAPNYPSTEFSMIGGEAVQSYVPTWPFVPPLAPCSVTYTHTYQYRRNTHLGLLRHLPQYATATATATHRTVER